MTSREKILGRAKESQPAPSPLPNVDIFRKSPPASSQKFKEVVESIGGKAHTINGLEEIRNILSDRVEGKRIVTTIEALPFGEKPSVDTAPHDLSNVQLAILQGSFAVEENGAIWLTEKQMGIRALPFICEHLAIVVNETDIIPGMLEAYEKMATLNYDFGTFLAGPSKTADIEQSLVLGAHGARTLSVFLLTR